MKKPWYPYPSCALKWFMPSVGDNGEGDDLRIVGWRSVKRHTDRCAARQRAEIEGDLAGGTGGDQLPVALDGERRCRFIDEVEQREHLAGDLLHGIGMLVVHDRTPPYQAAASSGAAPSVICPVSPSDRSASCRLRSAAAMRMCAMVSWARIGACSAGWLV